MNKVILDEVFADDILELEDRVNRYIEEQKGYRVLNINITKHVGYRNNEFLGAQIVMIEESDFYVQLDETFDKYNQAMKGLK